MDHLDRWSNLPNGVLSDDPPVRGIRRAGGKIECQRCTRQVDDNRSNDDLANGRMPSCPHCWVALAVEDEQRHSGSPEPAETLDGIPCGKRRQRIPYRLPTGTELGVLPAVSPVALWSDYARKVAADWKPAIAYLERSGESWQLKMQPVESGNYQFPTCGERVAVSANADTEGEILVGDLVLDHGVIRKSPPR
jgi:hypothetical protein